MPTAAREFQVMVKPGGAVCNLDCTNCDCLVKDQLYPEGGPTISALDRSMVSSLGVSF